MHVVTYTIITQRNICQIIGIMIIIIINSSRHM
jgi:hypothetical protein